MNEEICQVPVTTRRIDQILQAVQADINNHRQSMLIAINPEKIMRAHEDSHLMDILKQADYPIPDGIGVVLASKWRKGQIRERITGVDMMLELVRLASEHNYRIFLYGAKPEVVKQAGVSLKKQYPDLQIVGTVDGYEQDTDKLIRMINEAKPDILFVALGSPKQEEWILSHREQLNVTIFQGVGGSFDVVSGNIKRAPSIFRRVGLEWLYRLLTEPKRIKRQLVLPKFLFKVLQIKKQ